MKKPSSPWVPVWEEVAGAAANIARRNLWRVRPLYEMSDLMSDAYLVFLRLVRRYPLVIDPPHFMRLYLTSWTRTLHSMASRRSKSATGHAVGGFKQPVDPKYDPVAAASSLMPSWQQDSLLVARIQSASPALRALVAGLERKHRPRRCARMTNGTRITTNEFLCRIAEVNPEAFDLRAELMDLLNLGSV